jgi:hypothetical protein
MAPRSHPGGRWLTVTLAGSGDVEDPYVVDVRAPLDTMSPAEALRFSASMREAANELV